MTRNTDYRIDYKARKAYDVLYKVLVIGESSVGKTALVSKYQKPDEALPNLLPTIGIDYRLVDIAIDGLRVRVQLWDTVGQERYRTMTKNFFRGAKGILLLFDVTNRESFIKAENWVNSLKSNDLDHEEVFMIGNKVDLEDKREVSYEDGRMLATGYGMKYYETSAKSGQNVKETIEQLIYNMKDGNNPFQYGTRRDSDKWAHLFEDNEETEVTKLKPLSNKQKLSSRCCQRSISDD